MKKILVPIVAVLLAGICRTVRTEKNPERLSDRAGTILSTDQNELRADVFQTAPNDFTNRKRPETADDDRYVVVLSLDGCRSDYPDRASTPTLDSLAAAGIRSTFIPAFPSLTFPNHYSMATGLHPDRHGLVNNSFYDPGVHRFYSTRLPHTYTDPFFYGGEPIWTTAGKHGIKCATFYWVGSEIDAPERRPSIWKKFEPDVSFRSRADSVIAWLSRPVTERPRLIMWYLEEPDLTGHRYTPESPEINVIMEKIDREIGRFLSRMRGLDIAGQIDFILVSDHGMATYTPERTLNLWAYLPRDSFDYCCGEVPMLLYTHPGYRETAYNRLRQLPHVRVWKKEEIPARYHYGSNARIGDLVLLPDLGYRLVFEKNATSVTGGTHGYDNFSPEMEAIFYAAGPSFKKGVRVPPMANVNLYLLIASLLRIAPAPNDGDSEVVSRLLVR